MTLTIKCSFKNQDRQLPRLTRGQMHRWGRFMVPVILTFPKQCYVAAPKWCGMQGSILAFFQTRQPGKDVRKDTCPDKILLAHSKLGNN